VQTFDHQISNYFYKQIIKSFISISFVLILIIFGNQIYIVIKNSVSEGLIGPEIFQIIFLKLLRDTNFIFNLSFILALISVLNKLYKSSEMVVVKAAGVGDVRLIKILSPLIIFFVVLSSINSLFFSPIFKEEIERIKESAKLRPEFIFFKEGTFQDFQNGNITFFASNIIDKLDSQNQDLENVFLYSKNEDKITVAENAQKIVNPYDGSVYLNLFNGKTYGSFMEDANLSYTDFQSLEMKIYAGKTENINKTSIESKSVFDLNISIPKELSELLYRISSPISLVILSLISIFIARTEPRNKRNLSIGYGIFFFLIYYYIINYSKSIVGPDLITIFQSFLITHIIFFFVLFVFFLRQLKI